MAAGTQFASRDALRAGITPILASWRPSSSTSLSISGITLAGPTRSLPPAGSSGGGWAARRSCWSAARTRDPGLPERLPAPRRAAMPDRQREGRQDHPLSLPRLDLRPGRSACRGAELAGDGRYRPRPLPARTRSTRDLGGLIWVCFGRQPAAGGAAAAAGRVPAGRLRQVRAVPDRRADGRGQGRV